LSRVVVLDSTPLGLLANPTPGVLAARCQRWAADLAAAGVRVLVPEMADYEVRRELLRAGRQTSVDQLDQLATTYDYLPLTTLTMRAAADLWATARQQGVPTAGQSELDGDVIVAAQALILNDPSVLIATGNVRHIGRYAPAELWWLITP
jgi:hypothetical protein